MISVESDMAFLSRTTIFILGILLSQVMSACMPQQSEAQTHMAQAFPQVTIPQSEVRSLESSATGRSYDLYVHLPEEY